MQKFCRLILLLCLVFFLSVPAFAANTVRSIAIEAVINPDGSMDITQTWQTTFEEGTEVFIPINDVNNLTIGRLQVWDETGIYETMQNWDVSKNFQEKANKCGIYYTDNGYEICFGISQYGDNRYVVSYRLFNVVGSYSDRDGVNFRFVNDEMNTTPTDIVVEIRLADGTPIQEEIAEAWAFGFDGQIEFLNGAIRAYTQSPIYPENHVTVLFSFEKGILSPSRQETGSFEIVKKTAFEGSDYDYNTQEYPPPTVLETILGMFILLAGPIFLFFFFKNRSKKGRKTKLNKFAEKYGYFRSLPNQSNVNATYVLGKQFALCQEGSIFAVGLLRLIDLGCLTPIAQEQTGFMGTVKELLNLRLMGSNHNKMNEYDEYLYTILEAAAGLDGILQTKELEQFISSNYHLLISYLDKCEKAGKQYLNQQHCFKHWATPANLNQLTPAGEQELGQLLGFQKYLEDFSLIAQRGIKELPIWKELLSYAMLFGIADKLAEQMKDLYPQISHELTSYTQNLSTVYFYQNSMIRHMQQTQQQNQQKRSNGKGGFSSFGGGSGWIGGGSTGGTR